MSCPLNLLTFSGAKTNWFAKGAVTKCFVPGVVLQLQVSQSTDQDLVTFEVHPADLPRRFQQSLKVDNYYQP